MASGYEKTESRRASVRAMMERGLHAPEIARQLSTPVWMIQRIVDDIRRIDRARQGIPPIKPRTNSAEANRTSYLRRQGKHVPADPAGIERWWRERGQ